MPLPQGSAVLKQLFTLFAEADEASGLCGNEVFVFLFFPHVPQVDAHLQSRSVLLFLQKIEKKELKGSLAD